MDQLHPALQRFIEQVERQARAEGKLRRTVGPLERMFLQKVWGPEFQFNFEGLHAEYPFRDFRGRDRYVDFVYTKGGNRLVIELDGYTSHVRDIDEDEYDDHLERQNDLILQGWMVLRFSKRHILRHPMRCREKIKQSIGHWWTVVQGNFEQGAVSLWESRKQSITRIALRQGGMLRTRDITRHFQICRRSAHYWLQKMAAEGFIEPVRANQRITAYRIPDIP